MVHPSVKNCANVSIRGQARIPEAVKVVRVAGKPKDKRMS